MENYVHLLVSFGDRLETISDNDTTGSIKEDWYQANWELIVEGMLSCKGIVLEPYGDGADCNGASSRVLYPASLPSHNLTCTSSKGVPVYDFLNKRELGRKDGKIVFDRFVSMEEDGWYYEKAPFDMVLGQCAGEDVVVKFSEIDVHIANIE